MPRKRIPAEVALRVRDVAKNRCGYCLKLKLGHYPRHGN